MKKAAYSGSVISSLLMMTMVTAGKAQPAGGRRDRGPQVVSPELSADGKVTFRLVAPEVNAVILDNLIAQDRAVPMVVAMPDGHTTRPGVTGGGSFEDKFVRDIRPAIEKRYRLYTDSSHRAIAGLSMGGGQTRSITLADLDDYGHICVLSGGLVTPTDVEDADGFEGKVKLLFISCGSLENPNVTRANHEALQEIGIDNVVYISPDTAHEWRTWQRSLYQFAPLLFRD